MFNVTSPTEIYTLSLHDALPIFDDAETPLNLTLKGEALFQECPSLLEILPTVIQAEALIHEAARDARSVVQVAKPRQRFSPDRKSTRLNSSHQIISYAVFCLKKK